MKICFFAKVESPDILERVEFYAQDIRALRAVCDELVIATRVSELPLDCDVYYVWWWTYALFPLALAKLRGKKVVVAGVFNYDTPPRGTRGCYLDRPFWHRWMMRRALATADANIFCSQFEFERIPALLPTAGAVYVPHGVDTRRYCPADVPRERFLFNIAWSGALNAQRKCLFEILRAMPSILARHPDVRLLMAGKPGEAHADLVSLAQELDISHAVEFLGIITEEHKIDLMRRCAVYLSPSLFEGFGLAIAEAMACGAAVVTSPEGAITEVVGSAGRLASGRNPQAIADAVCSLLDDSLACDVLREAARTHIVSHFDQSHRENGLATVLSGLFSKSRAPQSLVRR